jgi:hypothetical protein
MIRRQICFVDKPNTFGNDMLNSAALCIQLLTVLAQMIYGQFALIDAMANGWCNHVQYGMATEISSVTIDLNFWG